MTASSTSNTGPVKSFQPMGYVIVGGLILISVLFYNFISKK
jgi:hypothetical protein